ncbi:MAG TPA: hypothetical protein VHI51_09095, partial [Ktedonobacterales bacterium]|nr:hypothetical protein [Ktedonobacterales bacterium]
TVVKPSSPDDTAGAALWDNRTSPTLLRAIDAHTPEANDGFGRCRVCGALVGGWRFQSPAERRIRIYKFKEGSASTHRCATASDAIHC